MPARLQRLRSDAAHGAKVSRPTTSIKAAPREITDAQAREQAEALARYVHRGGAASRWLSSKGFLPADRAAILLALSDLDG